MGKNRMRRLFVSIAVMVALTSMTAQNMMSAQERELPAPSMTGGMPMNEVVASRHSVRAFDPERPLDDALLGQLLWTAVGVNRPDAEPSAHGAPADRCNPTALNRQEIHAYLFAKDGVWRYQPHTHSLVRVAEGDCRALVAGTAEFSQDFVMEAPCSVVFVADLSGLPDDESTMRMALVDAGIACENLTLGCASAGVATVPRATMDTAGIAALLGLNPRQVPLMNNPLGYPRKRR